MNASENDLRLMARALELAAQGQGRVEPNPMVGCVIAQGSQILGEGWHRQFGGPHAEIEALRQAGPAAQGATMVVTLEPCCHQGKTPPCTQAIIDAGLSRLVAAHSDPFAQVDGGGIGQLEQAGIQVQLGLMQEQAARLNAPYFMLLQSKRPWIIAKWAMSLDGKIATQTGDSRWISCEASRQLVHALRGRVDAILVGRGTTQADDPLLTARPPGARTATRIVLDSQAALSPNSKLASTVGEAPVLVVAGTGAPAENQKRLTDLGVEVLLCEGETHSEQLHQLFQELGRRRMTNVLVEGGSGLLGALLDGQLVDEVHLFIAPKIIGGLTAPSPVAGIGVEQISQALNLTCVEVQQVQSDIYLRGLVSRDS